MLKTFKKAERLCSKKVIEALFDRKNPANDGFLVYPIRVVFQNNAPVIEQAPVIEEELQQAKVKNPEVLFSVSKRNFKHAVDRNLIRRRMRETYRLNKNLLIKKENFPIYLAFIYVAKEICDYNVIDKSMKKILGRMI